MLALWRSYGFIGLVRRTIHEARRYLGWYRSSPGEAIPGDLGEPLLVPDATAIAVATDREEALGRADRVLLGQYQAYRWDWRELPRSPSAWVVHPTTGKQFPPDPWYTIATYAPGQGDIKELWEPSRFGWVYDLVRGYLVAGDERYPEAFFQRLVEWLDGNPPFRGPNWACGQETSIRALALLHAEAAFRFSKAATPERMRRLATLLYHSGERVANAIGYGLSQRNNHGISESVGLVMLGARFRRVPGRGCRWLALGRRLIESEVRDQFTADGWYAQHSFVYQRLAMEMLVVAQRTLVSLAEPLSSAALQRLGASLRLLLHLMDPDTGQLPNFGANDGAYVYPVTLAGYRDFRPVVTAVAASIEVPLPETVAASTEVVAWLGLPPVGSTARLEEGVYWGPAGWVSATVGQFRVFLRAGPVRRRPGHIDQLQLDVRFAGREILVDPGTFAYNAAEPWRNGLTNSRVHNAPLIDGREIGVQGPAFLWYIWPQAQIREAAWDGTTARIVARRDDGVVRELTLTSDRLEVTDRLDAGMAEPFAVRWLLAPGIEPDVLQLSGEVRRWQAEEGDVSGWFSPSYGVRHSCWVAEGRPGNGESLTTILSAAALAVTENGSQ